MPSSTKPPEATEAWSPRVTRVLAPNPSPLTLEGTNTFVVAEPDAATAVVIDPGPADDGHAQAVVRACAAGSSWCC